MNIYSEENGAYVCREVWQQLHENLSGGHSKWVIVDIAEITIQQSPPPRSSHSINRKNWKDKIKNIPSPIETELARIEYKITAPFYFARWVVVLEKCRVGDSLAWTCQEDELRPGKRFEQFLYKSGLRLNMKFSSRREGNIVRGWRVK